MAITPPRYSSVQITGTMSMGYKDKPDLQKFCEYYKAKVEMTDRESFQRTAGVVQIGTQPYDTVGPETMTREKVVGVYLPESMLNELTMNHTRMMDESKLRRQNPVLMDMWNKYQMMLEIYK